MTVDSLSLKGILKDLEEIYFMALGKGNYSVALKTKELLGREAGLFSGKQSPLKKKLVSLNDLSDDDITNLIEELETKLKLDQRESSA